MGQRNLRILQLAPQVPFPSDDGGKISIANTFLQFVNQNHQVTFFAYNQNEIPENIIKEHLKIQTRFLLIILQKILSHAF